jgi:hypothetical protein
MRDNSSGCSWDHLVMTCSLHSPRGDSTRNSKYSNHSMICAPGGDRNSYVTAPWLPPKDKLIMIQPRLTVNEERKFPLGFLEQGMSHIIKPPHTLCFEIRGAKASLHGLFSPLPTPVSCLAHRPQAQQMPSSCWNTLIYHLASRPPRGHSNSRTMGSPPLSFAFYQTCTCPVNSVDGSLLGEHSSFNNNNECPQYPVPKLTSTPYTTRRFWLLICHLSPAHILEGRSLFHSSLVLQCWALSLVPNKF